MGTLLYYTRAVDSTILTALSSLATEQAKKLQKMMEKVKQLLNYCASQEEAIITYNKSKMIRLYTEMQDIATRRSCVAKPEDIFSYQTKKNYPPTTVQFLLT